MRKEKKKGKGDKKGEMRDIKKGEKEENGRQKEIRNRKKENRKKIYKDGKKGKSSNGQ